MDWNIYGYVMASEYRKSIVLSLNEKPKTPKEIANESDYHLSHVSNTLSDLSEEGIVECLTEERTKGRIYDVTTLGESIGEQMSK
jgi:predicted transcriptional regulator